MVGEVHITRGSDVSFLLAILRPPDHRVSLMAFIGSHDKKRPTRANAVRACDPRGRALHARCRRIGTQRHPVFDRSALTGGRDKESGKARGWRPRTRGSSSSATGSASGLTRVRCAPLRPRFAVTVASRCAHKVARSRLGGIARTGACATCFRRRARVAGGQPGSRSRRRTVHAPHHFIRKQDRRRFEPDRERSGDLDHVESA